MIRAEPTAASSSTRSARDIDEIFEIRAALETLALRRLHRTQPGGRFRRCLADLDEVERAIASAETNEQIRTANERFLAADQGFHKAIVEQSGNERLAVMINGLWGQIGVFQKAGTHVPGYIEVALRQHREIIGLLQAKRFDEAIEALRAHIRDMKTRIIADMAENEPEATP